MKRFLSVIMAALLVAVGAAAAPAWELTLTGRWTWGYDYIGQTGPQGFFGPYDSANPALLVVAANPHFSAYNAWVGARTIDGTQYGLVSGADASLQWVRAEMEPEFRINNAIRIRGLYEIGSLNPYTTAQFNGFSLYPAATFYGTHTGFAWGKWNQLWMTAQTPWGILVAGKRPAPFGTGLQYNGLNASSESLAIVAPYGPFRIGFFVHPHREERWLNFNEWQISTTTPTADTTRHVPGQRLIWDKNQIRQLQPGVFVTYGSGPFEMGALYEWWTQHDGPNEATTYGSAQAMNVYDGIAEDGTLYAKYNNGRFLFNAEVAWFRASVYQQPRIGYAFDGNIGDRSLAPRYLESWKYLLETGVYYGPTKVTFLFTYIPGPDRRSGIWIDRQSWENIAGGIFLGNAPVYLPYSLLMSYQYGGGLFALNNRGEGFMTDAITYGLRIDHAVAANLNVSGSFFMAQRQSKGWGWGSVTLASNTPRAVLQGGFGPVSAQWLNGNGTPWWDGGQVAPSIPDDNLGWEVTAGVDWKILEGVTINLRGAYWHVGEWFKFACVDKNFASAGNVVGGVFSNRATDGPWGWGVNPSRNIDPIVMFQGVMTVDF